MSDPDVTTKHLPLEGQTITKATYDSDGILELHTAEGGYLSVVTHWDGADMTVKTADEEIIDLDWWLSGDTDE